MKNRLKIIEISFILLIAKLLFGRGTPSREWSTKNKKRTDFSNEVY
jgi:hypothetical protein